MNVYSLFVAILLAFVTLIRLSVEVSNIDEQATCHVLTAAIVEPTRHVSSNVYDPTQTKQTTNRTKRKRGRKGGVKNRAQRRKYTPVLPVIITGNARSLNNKIDELQACTRYLKEYRDASFLCFSESWFQDNTPNSSIQLDNFHLERSDRDPTISQKTRGGGVCVYINEHYCHPKNVHIIEKKCQPDLEILSISLRPYYLPREFPKVILNVIYVPDKAHATSASAELTDILNRQMTSSPDALIITTGDFNHTTLNRNLRFYQHVTCPTREDATLDLCYSNVKDGYKCSTLPPLGSSDHDMIYLLPKYKTQLIRNPPVEKTISVWDECGRERLHDCFERTNWQVFIDSCTSINELNDHVTSYVNYCEDTCLEKKTIKCFNNNKPWVTKEMKALLNEKKRVFMVKNKFKCKLIQKEIKKKMKECKKDYKEGIEAKFQSNDSKGMWEGVKKVVGYKDKQIKLSVDKDKEQTYADELNSFYSRFDNHDFSDQIKNIKSELNTNIDSPPIIQTHQVNKVFKSLKVNKACGPDNLKPRILKCFAKELCFIFTYIFNQSLELNIIPEAWKTSKIVPVPKSKSVKEMNDLRPIALTSILVKCLERLVLSFVKPVCQPCLDPLQFAYRANRSVEDAILLFTDNVYRHIDKPKRYVRSLFIDFSSAFNTIQPHILIPKLQSVGVSNSLCLWILDFLTGRPQFVFLSVNDNVFESTITVTNTGAPQGTVLAPVLFTIYTNDCRGNFPNIPIIKYADDTSIQALIKSDIDLLNYYDEIARFVTWCNDNFLLLNVKKTKELIFDFRTKDNSHSDIEIAGQKVEKVTEYKYLGIIFDEKLSWHNQANKVQKKINQRLYFLRKLHSFQVHPTILSLFYQSCILSLLNFCLPAWGGNVKDIDSRKIDRCLKSAGKLIGHNVYDTLETIFLQLCSSKLRKIILDTTHPLNSQIRTSVIEPGRLIHFTTSRARYFNSFLPSSVRNS